MTYSLDLINASLNYYKVSNLCVRKVAKIFGISKSILNKWSKELPLKYNNYENKTIITVEMLNFLKNSLNQNPYQIQKDLVDKINLKFNLNISVNVIQKMLKIIGYSKKKAIRKLFNKNLNEHKCKRNEFKRKIKKINKEDIICLDEVAVDRNTYNLSGYCHKSKRLQYYVDINQLRFKKSLIVAIDQNKVVKYKTSDNKNINGEIFIEFIKELTLNLKGKIILMDNVSFHQSKEVIELIEEHNKVLFIPPYSPEFNPIEKLFSVFKNYLNKKVNVITKFKNLENHISYFFKITKNFSNYYKYSFILI